VANPSSALFLAGSCGAIDAQGVYTAPGSAPSPNNFTVVAISADDPLQSGSANLNIAFGANILALHPASVYAGAANGFTLRVDGSNFAASTPGPGSVLLIAGTARTTTCNSVLQCTAPVTAADVSVPGNLSIQIRNRDNTTSNSVSLLVIAQKVADELISLTSPSPTATGKDIVVVDPTTAGVSLPNADVDLNVAALGSFSTANNSCVLAGNPVPSLRPVSGVSAADICLFSASGLDTSMALHGHWTWRCHRNRQAACRPRHHSPHPASLRRRDSRRAHALYSKHKFRQDRRYRRSGGTVK